MKINKNILILIFLCIYGVSAQAQIARCKGKYFGNIIANTVHSNYTELWNQTTAENGSKWESIDRGNGVYNFASSDLSYNAAKNSGGAFKFHALIWGAQAPMYLANASPEVIETAIRNWYQAVQDHYDPMGGLDMIDVFNEPVNAPVNQRIVNLTAALTRGYRSEPANQGDLNNPYGWIIWTYQLARRHFPNSVLLINEFNVEHNWNNCREEYVRMSNAIKNAPNLTDGRRNLIDGIGLQAHGIENLSANAWRGCIDDVYARTGLPIHISEFDIAAEPNEEHQRTKFQEFITIAWEHPHVAGITLWGYIQGQTWIRGNGVTGPGGTDTGIMYANGQDRPAMAWLRSYMASRPSLSCCPAPAPFGDCSNVGVPVVSLTSPLDNAVFVAPASVTLSASASTPQGSVVKVDFYLNNERIVEKYIAPYNWDVTDLPAGNYTVRAVVFDNQGNTAEDEITFRVNVPQAPYGGSPHPIPGTIQAEEFDHGGNGFAYFDDTPGSQTGVEFRTDEDVDIEICTDAGGGYNVGWATAGEWLEYTVDVTQGGFYELDLRIACDGDDRTISVSMDGSDIAADVEIPNTTGWQVWQTVTVSGIELQPGQKIMRISIGDVDYVNINFVAFNLVEAFVRAPYNGVPHLIPGRIQAQEFDFGGQGIGYNEANNNGNEGGADLRNGEVDIEATQDVDGEYNVGYILTGEWLAYTVEVASTGLYTLDARMATVGDGKFFHIEINDEDVTGPIEVPNTDGWQVWETVSVDNIPLTAGEHVMKIVFDSDYMNLNWVEFRSLITSFDESESSEIVMYPNPFTTGGINIQSKESYQYTITNVDGILVESGVISQTAIVGNNLNKGMYFITLENDKQVITQKIIKQ